MRKTVHLGTKLGSFASAAESVAETLEIELTTKRVERWTERIGQERVTERKLSIAEWESLPLVAKLLAPKGIKAPAVACVSCDGGRMQRCDLPAGAKSHWCETKVGVLLELQPNPQDADPCPQVPSKFLDVVRMEQVTREIKRAVPKGQSFASLEKSGSPSSHTTANADTTNGGSPETLTDSAEEIFAEPPVVESRDVIASLADSAVFGKHLAAHAWSLGFAAALLKVFIADGSSTNWGIWQREFKHLGFVPVLDFIHALTYVYSAAMAGRSREAGAPVYVRWITWVWQGEVNRVIAELAARAVELGPLPADATDTDPRQIVAGAPSGSADLSDQPAVAHELPDLPQDGPADHLQPHRIDGQTNQPPRQRQRKVLDRIGRRSVAATPSRPTLRHRPPRHLLAHPHSPSHRHQKLPTTHANYRLTKFAKCVVRPDAG